MNLNKLNPNLVLELAAGVAVVGLAWYLVHKASGAASSVASAIADGAGAVGTAINPANPGNIINRGVLAVGTSMTGDQNWSLGGAIYDAIHPTPDTNAPTQNTTPAQPGAPSAANTAFGMIDPTSAW